MLNVLEHDTFVSFKLASEHRQALRRLAASQDRWMSSVLRELVEIALDGSSWEGNGEPATPSEPPAKPSPFVRAARAAREAYLIAAAIDLKTISTYMGHASVAFTIDRYGHLLPDTHAEQVSKLDAFLDLADTSARLAQLDTLSADA